MEHPCYTSLFSSLLLSSYEGGNLNNPVTIIFNKMLKVTEVCVCIKNSRFPKKPSKKKGLCTCPPYGLSVTWGGGGGSQLSLRIG